MAISKFVQGAVRVANRTDHTFAAIDAAELHVECEALSVQIERELDAVASLEALRDEMAASQSSGVIGTALGAIYNHRIAAICGDDAYQPSVESYGSLNGNYAVTASIESIGEKIKAGVQAVWRHILELWNKFKTWLLGKSATTACETAKEQHEEAKEAKAHPKEATAHETSAPGAPSDPEPAKAGATIPYKPIYRAFIDHHSGGAVSVAAIKKVVHVAEQLVAFVRYLLEKLLAAGNGAPPDITTGIETVNKATRQFNGVGWFQPIHSSAGGCSMDYTEIYYLRVENPPETIECPDMGDMFNISMAAMGLSNVVEMLSLTPGGLIHKFEQYVEKTKVDRVEDNGTAPLIAKTIKILSTVQHANTKMLHNLNEMVAEINHARK